MCKLVLTFLFLMIVSGLVYGPFAEALNKDCHQGCDCCGESCECPLQRCASNGQPIAEVDSRFSFRGIPLNQHFQIAYLNLYSYEFIRKIFRPPRHLSWFYYLFNVVLKRSKTMKKTLFSLFLIGVMLLVSIPTFAGEICCMKSECGCGQIECCKDTKCTCKGECCKNGECNCKKVCGCMKK